MVADHVLSARPEIAEGRVRLLGGAQIAFLYFGEERAVVLITEPHGSEEAVLWRVS